MPELGGDSAIAEDYTKIASGEVIHPENTPDIYLTLDSGETHKLDGISDRLKSAIAETMTMDRDIHPDGGYVYEYQSFMDQVDLAGMDTLAVREIDLALKAIDPALVTPDGPPADNTAPLPPGG